MADDAHFLTIGLADFALVRHAVCPRLCVMGVCIRSRKKHSEREKRECPGHTDNGRKDELSETNFH